MLLLASRLGIHRKSQTDTGNGRPTTTDYTIAVVILHAASEVVGFAKTGGLADVTGSLPPALARRGHQCLVILPLYQCARHGKIPVEPTDHYVTVPVGHRSQTGRLWRSKLPD